MHYTHEIESLLYEAKQLINKAVELSLIGTNDVEFEFSLTSPYSEYPIIVKHTYEGWTAKYDSRIQNWKTS